MPETTDESTRFVLLVRGIAAPVRELGLTVPHFQSPPRSAHLDRSIQRRSSRDCVVAVRLRNRPFADVVTDVIDGIVACNDLAGDEADSARSSLRGAVAQMDDAGDEMYGSATQDARIDASSEFRRAPGEPDRF